MYFRQRVNVHEKYMGICLELASEGLREAMPNPSVGAVIVYDDKIIGKGYTRPFGNEHAEVQAVRSVQDKSFYKKSTLYVSLEPCAHHGKTPPCTDLIIESGIRHVIVGCEDPNPIVNGKGIQKLRDCGIRVEVGILKEECQQLNIRFFTFHQNKRPYVILKWAQTKDGFIDRERKNNETGINWITDPRTKGITHQWRAEEMAVLVGFKTVENDNPKLTVRALEGKHPIRLVIDKMGALSDHFEVFNGEAPVIVFTKNRTAKYTNAKVIEIDFNHAVNQILAALFKEGILSVIIEGGASTLSLFLKEGAWDEARVLTGKTTFGSGLKAPELKIKPNLQTDQFGDNISYYFND